MVNIIIFLLYVTTTRRIPYRHVTSSVLTKLSFWTTDHKILILSQISPGFLPVCSTSLLKTLWEKEKLLMTSSFSFSHSVFYPFWRTFCHFHKTQNCRLQTLSVWKSLKFVVRKRVKHVGTHSNDSCNHFELTLYSIDTHFDPSTTESFLKHCGKRRNCSLRAISPFPTVLSKDLSCRHVNTRACLGKGKKRFRIFLLVYSLLEEPYNSKNGKQASFRRRRLRRRPYISS